MGDAQDIEMDGSSEYDEENSSQISSNINNPTSKRQQHEENRRGKGSETHTQNGTSGGKKKNPGKQLAQESSVPEKLSNRELKKIRQQIDRLEHQPGRTKKKREYHVKQSEKKSPESDHSLEQRKDEKESMSSTVLGSSMGNTGDRFSRKNMMETFQLGSSLSVGASQDSIGFIPELVTSQSSHGGSSSKNNKNGNNLQNTNNTNNTTNSSIFKTSLPTLTAAASAEGSTKIQIRYQNPDTQPANSSKSNNNNLNNGNKSSDAASINNNNSNNGMGIIVTEDDSEVSASCDHFDQEPGENADEEEDTSLHLISKPTPSYNSKSVLLPTPNHTLPSQFSGQAGNNENQLPNTINILAGNLPGCEISPEIGCVSGGNPSIAAAGKTKKNIPKKPKDSSISVTSPASSTANITAPTAIHLQSSNSQEGSASKIQVICTTNEAKATTSRQPSRSSFSNSNISGSTQVAQPQTVVAIPTHSSPQFQANNGSNSNSAVITLIKQNNQNNNNNHTQQLQLSPETITQFQTSNIMLQPTSSSNLIQMRITPEEPQQVQDKNNSLQDSTASATKQTPQISSATVPDCDNSNAPNLSQKLSSNNRNSMNTNSQTTNPPVLNPSADPSPTKAQNPIAIPAQHTSNSKQIVKSPISIKNLNAKTHIIMPLPSGHNMITIPIVQSDYFEPVVALNENEESIQPSKKKRKGGRPSSKNDRNNNNKSVITNNKSDQLESNLSREEIPVVHNHSKFMRQIVPLVSDRAEKRKTDNEYKERMKKGPLNQNLFSDQPSLFLRLNDYQDDEQRNRLLQAEEIAENSQKAEKIFLKEGQLFSSPQLLTLQPFLNYLPQQPKIPLVFAFSRNGGQDTEEHPTNNQTITHLQSKETNGNTSQGISSRIKKVDSQASLMDQTNVISDTIVKKFKSSNILEGFNEPFSSLHTDFAASYLSPEFCKGVLSSFNRHQDFATEDYNIEY